MMAQVLGIESLAWRAPREAVRVAWVLGLREIRTALRTPAYLIPNMVVPIFFFFVLAAALDGFAVGFGVENFEGVLLPMAIIFAVQGGSAGLNMVADIQSGYLDKLLATPVNRLAILIGAMSADFLRVMLQATLVVLVGFAAGIDFATGVPGAVALILLSSLFGLAFSGIGFAVALKTGNAQSTQAVSFLFMPLLLLSPLFAPDRGDVQPDDVPPRGPAFALGERMGCGGRRRGSPGGCRNRRGEHDLGAARFPEPAALAT